MKATTPSKTAKSKTPQAVYPQRRHYREPLTDAQRKHVESFKVPTDCWKPSTYWIANLDYESAMPTDLEIRQIRSYIEYIVTKYFNLTWQEKIFAKPFPADGGQNTVTFRKGGRGVGEPNSEEGWAYRFFSWDGYTYAPCRFSDPDWKVLTLEQVMDRKESFDHKDPVTVSAAWVKWKAEHPDIFPPGAQL